MSRRNRRLVVLSSLGLLLSTISTGCTQGVPALILPEQRALNVHDPVRLPPAPLPDLPPPATVSNPQPYLRERHLSLDEAIRIALANSRVVRVLAGISAVSSGRTIYDPAISNTLIDQEQARFDPRLEVQNNFDRLELPQGAFDPLDPAGAHIGGRRTDGYHLSAGLAKTTVTGGTAKLSVTDDRSRFQPGVFPLNPENRHGVTLSYVQPLLQGGGTGPNLAPIVLARINTERSYFQFKDAVQESVRGVIEAYWALVFARTDVWVRQQQVKQGEFAYNRAKTRGKTGLSPAAEAAQTKSALANFKASLIGAEANQIQREAALRNILGLAPSDATRLVPVSPPTTSRVAVFWDEIVRLAEELRPDLIELKLVLEADQQLLTQARNQALPRLDAVALYRWNGLEGTTPGRTHLAADAGQFSDWSLGVNFSVPLGLRGARAALRQQELILARNRANLDQGMHNAVHDLATSTRNVAQFYEQYRSFKEAREAARVNLDQQLAEYESNRVIFLNVLQAITDWGNALSAEAQTLTRYNTELANLERETGTILQTHGVYFFEERYGAIGPLGRLARQREYPSSMPPAPNKARYPVGSQPAENIFDLKVPVRPESKAPSPEPAPSNPPEPPQLLPAPRLGPPQAAASNTNHGLHR